MLLASQQPGIPGVDIAGRRFQLHGSVGRRIGQGLSIAVEGSAYFGGRHVRSALVHY